MVADAELFDQRDDLAIALKQVVIEVFEVGCPATGKRDGLAAEARRALPERHVVTALGQSERRRHPGDTAADDADRASMSGVSLMTPYRRA